MLIFSMDCPTCAFALLVSLFRCFVILHGWRRRRVITLYFVVVQPLCLAAVVAHCRRVDHETMDYDTMADNV